MLRRLSLQSKLILMLLVTSIGSTLVVGWLGYDSGRRALRAAVANQLIGLRNARKTQVEMYLETLRNVVTTLAANGSTVDALREFRDAYRQLDAEPVTPECDRGLEEFYRQTFIPALAKNSEGDPDAAAYLPRAPAARHLQCRYLAGTAGVAYGSKRSVDACGDGSRYDAVHARYHPAFRKVSDGLGFEDLLLVDVETGGIVYTLGKTVEFGTSLLDGPHANSHVAELFKQVRRGTERGDYRFADFERYRPSLNRPASFIATGVFDGPRMIGVLILHFPIDRINAIMTGRYGWMAEGLGRTGESYLVGSDLFLRSPSRFFFEDPQGTLEAMRGAGVPGRVVDAIGRTGVIILNLQMGTEAARRAVAGEQGILEQRDYRGEPVLSAYGPLDVDRVRWGILAEMDADEAFAPIREFGRRLLASTVAIALAVSLMALVLAHLAIRPVSALSGAARRVASGDLEVEVPSGGNDELGQLAAAFNEMTRSLRLKGEQLEQKVRENEELLLNILPAPAAERMRTEGSSLTQSFADVTVLFADILGFDDLQDRLGDDRALELLNDLVVAFDEASEHHGVEKVKSIGSAYMAVCGLSVQRPDHTNRILEFARELIQILHRFNTERGTALVVEIGINAGPVVGGVVGRKKFIYDLWGETVSIARGLPADGETSIQVTRAVHDRVSDLHAFDRCGSITIRGKGAVEVWTLRG